MLLSAVLSCAVVAAQNITGRVVDIDNAPVDGASVVLQTADSVLVDVALTAPDGGFSFATQLSAYRIIVQHISYETKVVTDIRKDIGDIVLDAFVGSGTTVIAAKELNRKYIGYEIDEKYFNITNERLNELDDEFD